MIASVVLETLERVWPYAAAGLSLVLAVLASAHAVLFKRDPRSAVLWTGLVWLVPLGGAVLYAVLGINRIRRRAQQLRGGEPRRLSTAAAAACRPDHLREQLLPSSQHLSALAGLVDKVVARPLLAGNRLDPLHDGDAAFPAMLEAIAAAQRTLALSTYIFDRDAAGEAFARALGDAVRRGVAVRVLVDATGSCYSWPAIWSRLRREGVRHARFLPTFPFGPLVTLNLRNHRKLLVVDGRLGFTGGLNLRVGHWLAKHPRNPVRDLHFRVEGPVVAQLQEAFAEDWQFTTGEVLQGAGWFPPLPAAGPAFARGITDGPDEDFETLRWTLLGALASAQRAVRIMTPYFLPDATLISALNLAALRGVAVDVVLPAKNNLPFVHWASQAHWWQILERGCRLWLTPPPFDHSKLFIVDDGWTLIGSTNWDPRSLRLNFEFNVEAYDPSLARTLAAWFDQRRQEAREVTLAEADSRPFAVRLRDGAARLLTPYL